MVYSHIPLKRAVSAGVLAYFAQYVLTFALIGSRTGALLQSIVIDPEYGGPESLPAFVDPTIPAWKAVGWVLHSAHNVKLIVPLPNHGGTQTLNVVSHADARYQLLYLLAPIILLATGYLVARTGRTYGVRGEQYAGASVALGYLPCCFAGALLFSVGHPAIAPDVLTSILYAGLGYPVVFGWFGGLAVRRRSETESDAAASR